MSITVIGLNTAKSAFQIHAVNGAGKVEIRRKLRQGELTSFFEKQEACTVVMEACGAKHYWAWVLTGLGYKVKLIAPEAVRLFVKKGKTETVAMLHTLLGQRTPDRLSKPTREHMEIQQ